MSRYIITFLAVIAGVTAVRAQGPELTTERSRMTRQIRELLLVDNPWVLTNNAAGLGVVPVLDNGSTSINGERSSGDYHRAQEGRRMNSISFDNEKYSKLNDNLYLYGGFTMEMNREYDRAWSDVPDTYSGNPYYYGSGRKGTYDTQAYRIQGKLASGQINRFHFGFAVDYNAMDFSRIKDPRPRNIIGDYTLTPSVTYALSDKSTIGIDASYHFRKQYLKSITTVEEDKYPYYAFYGMEICDLVQTGIFEREFSAVTWGGHLQYFLNSGNVKWLLNLGYGEMTEKVWQIRRSSPGRYMAEIYSASSILSVKTPGYVHSFNADFRYFDGYADYYLQEEIVITDELNNTSRWWETLYKARTYMHTKTQMNVRYKLFSKQGSDSYKWFAGLTAGYSAFESEYLLPRSFMKISQLTASADYGRNIFTTSKGHSLFIDAKFSILVPGKHTMRLNDGSSIIATNVLRPDILYYRSKAIGGGLNAEYSFPIRTRKNIMTGFAAFHGEYLSSAYRNAENKKTDRNSIGLSVGLILN